MSVLVSPLFQQLPWLEHGFGTRDSALSQDRMASLTQIHSAAALVADRASGCVGTGDALITDQPDIVISVRSADCFPILLADARRRVVAAIHAGWRGTASRISAEVLQKMTEQFGTAPSDVWAAIGPGIGPCCYAVGDDVARQLGLDRAGRADLAQVNRDHLISAGVAEDRIETLRICTYCDPARFHSYRRDKLEAGRMISYVCMV